MSNHQEISSFIWTVCDDILRGLFKPTEYGRVILPFTVLRRLDCVLEPTKDEVYELYQENKDEEDTSPIFQQKTNTPYYNHSKYDLSRLKGDPSNVLMNFRNYINGYSPQVREIMENFNLDILLEKLHKNKRLYELIEKFTKIDLHPDIVNNHQMGQIYEELLRKFSEMSNEESGEHYTPRDVVKLLVSLVFGGNTDDLKGSGKIRSMFDPCVGTGSMLTIGKEWVQKNMNPDLKMVLNGQELNDITYSICSSYFLITGENPDNIKLGNSLSDDKFQGKTFDYMMTSPPFGVSWKSDKQFIKNEEGDPNGRFFVGTPRTSDGSLLFLQHLISKMDDSGSRIGIILNESPLFTGDSGSGESEIRRWIIENDWLECIISLPDQLLHNTGIQTYIWILSNKKDPVRKGKIQLIKGSEFFTTLSKSIGYKKKYITEKDTSEIVEIYTSFDENEFSQIFSNKFFGYTKVKVRSPKVDSKNNPLVSEDGNPIPDDSKDEFENIPITLNTNEYFSREVKPYKPSTWIDSDYERIGYRIDFNRVFLDRDIKSLKKDFPTSEWIRIKYIGSFTDEICDNCMLIPVHKSLNRDSIIPVNKKSESPLPDNFNKKFFKIFKIEDERYESKSLTGYLESKYGSNDLKNCYKGISIQRLEKDYFLNLKVPIFDHEIQKYYNLNTELLSKINSEIKKIEQEVLYQFSSEDSEKIYRRLYSIFDSTDQIVKEDEINYLIQKGESLFTEFKETFHTNVRNKYQTDKKIRHTSLKSICGFLNKEGGNLLVGVSDDGTVKGIEKDDFRDNDHYLLKLKDLIKTNLGTNSLHYVDYNIFRVDGKKILLVECKKSKDPVFLNGNFYVRMNPSTEKLEGTEMYKYLTENFGQ